MESLNHDDLTHTMSVQREADVMLDMLLCFVYLLTTSLVCHINRLMNNRLAHQVFYGQSEHGYRTVGVAGKNITRTNMTVDVAGKHIIKTKMTVGVAGKQIIKTNMAKEQWVWPESTYQRPTWKQDSGCGRKAHHKDQRGKGKVGVARKHITKTNMTTGQWV